MSDKERIAYIIGWLHGFEPMVWALVGDKLADETANEYSRLVYELAALLGVKKGGGGMSSIPYSVKAAHVAELEAEIFKLRKERDTLCRRIDELCMENEQLRNQHTAKAKRNVVSNHDTDCATGHSECSACGGTVNPYALFCEHCGAEFKEDA